MATRIPDATHKLMREEIIKKGKVYWVLVRKGTWYVSAKYLVGEDWASTNMTFLEGVVKRLIEDGHKAEIFA